MYLTECIASLTYLSVASPHVLGTHDGGVGALETAAFFTGDGASSHEDSLLELNL